MFTKPLRVVSIVSGILLLYCILVGFRVSLPLITFIFAISPFLLLWIAYSIIRHGAYDGTEFQQDEEWGYQDKKKEDLWVF